jgi:hypothetical protein
MAIGLRRLTLHNKVAVTQVLVIPVLVLALAVATTLLVIRVQQSNRNQNDAIRSVLCFFERRVKASPDITAAQKTRAIRLYGEALATIHEKRCP